MRFANFLNVENEETGLSGEGEMAREVFAKHRNTPKDDLRKMVINMLLDITSSNRIMD